MKNKRLTIGILSLLVILSGTALIVAVDAFNAEDAKTKALELVPGSVNEIELENGFYEVDVSNSAGGKEIVFDEQGNLISVNDEEIDEPITGSALERASQVALDYIGQGRVTDSEIGDEDGYYEIEITLDNGREVDVHLDENFKVLSTEYA